MIRLPPRSTLFPTRRSSDLKYQLQWSAAVVTPAVTCTNKISVWFFYQVKKCASFISPKVFFQILAPLVSTSSRKRSEEHTSELQSHSDLVCRLLLEKKKKEL